MKIALIGCGAATERYYIPALKKESVGLSNIYFVDHNQSSAEKMVDLLGMGEVATDYKQIINKIDGALVVLPNYLHYPVGLDLIKSGIHILCEKPLADTYEQGLEMVNTAKDMGVQICVNNTRRMFPVNKYIRQMLAQNEIGPVKGINYTEGSTFGWASATGFYVDPKISSRGLLSDLGPHVIDILCWWLDKKPEVKNFTDDSFGGPESVARIIAELSGSQIEIFLNRLVDLESSFEIVCEKGTIVGKPMDWGNFVVREQNGKNKHIKIHCKQKNYPSFVAPILNNFIKVVHSAEKPLVSGKDVLPSLEFIDQCYNMRKRFPMPWYDDIKVSEEKTTETVLVTGATGFIGASIVEQLHISKKKKIKAVVHNWSNAARLGRLPVEIVDMDLMDENSINNALKGVDAVIHCAKGDYDVTVNGTKKLLSAALKNGLKRFVHMSTTEIYGKRQGQITEDMDFEYTGNEYNRMKIDAEKECWKFHEKGLPIVLLRPSIVYGPFSKNWTLHYSKMLIERKLGIFEKIGEGNCNLIYINDLVKAVLLALDSKNAIGEAFNVSGPEVITWNEYFKLLNEALDLPPIKVIKKATASLKTKSLMPIRKIGGFARDHFMQPIKKMAELSSIADNMLRKIENTLKTNPASDDLKLLSKCSIYSTKKANDVIGYKPDMNIKNGITTSASWILHNRIMNKD